MSDEASRRGAREDIRESMRTLRANMARLHHLVGTHMDLKDVDLECLDLLARHGALSPTELARIVGLHPATMTGILDRLERKKWITRGRAPGDRRGVVVEVTHHRLPEMLRLYAGMNAALSRICAGYDDKELELIAGFLRQVTDAGRQAANDLSST